MIFLDTSAIFALANTNDLNHERAVDLFGRAIAAGESFLVHNYVLLESAALLQRRLSFDSALRLLHDAEGVRGSRGDVLGPRPSNQLSG